MIYIELNSPDVMFNLAAEEYVMRNFPLENPVFMLWRTEKCVVIGRNQIAAAEIDLQAAHSLGIKIVRRSSGGGAVFSDPGNIMQSFISSFNKSDNSNDSKKIEYAQLIEPMAKALRRMGIPAIAEGRNDITVNGRKISGLAQYAIKDRLCTHGSLLYNTNLDLLTQVLKTDPEKISSKALKSVRARVVNLCDYFNPKISAAEFFDWLKSNLFDEINTENYNFTKQDIEKINIIKTEKYANPEWINGATPRFSFHNAKRFHAGKIEIFLNVEYGIINSCKIFGDFLGVFPVEGLEEKLINQIYDFNLLSDILSKIDIKFYLGGVTRDELLECLF
ncbi:MAG: lipoate--protein ligase [Oscillospiraceae bacterium]|nr:lipoate--protein ligase [Oscillospiraceae bacterium]